MSRQATIPMPRRLQRLGAICAVLGLTATVLKPAPVQAASEAIKLAATTQRQLDRLVRAYPDFLLRHEKGVLVWRDGTRMPFDDGKGAKTFNRRLAAPDLQDMFYVRYPPGRRGVPPPLNADPGRVRYQPFFNKMYGDCRKGSAAGKLVKVVWLPGKWGRAVKVTRINGVAGQLRKVSAELDRLPARFNKYLFPVAGTFNCRVIAGTRRLSMHAYATAIDINLKHAHYWRWSKSGRHGRYRYRNRVPWEIVSIFERHGFIWGGKWYHYDTMHFEYRPEFLAAGR